MALVGLVRVGTSKQETARQHDDLDPICVKVFEEKISGTIKVADRPGLQAALDYLRPGDLLTVQEADRLGRNLLEGLIVLNDLFQQGVSVKILSGIAAGEHTERNLILDLALALAEDRRRDISRKTRNGLAAAARRGNKGGRPRVVDDDKRRAILARRAEGQSLREISRGVGVSLAVVHAEVQAAELALGQDRPMPDVSKYDELLPSRRTADGASA
ncbi:recombinase family protein [Nocardia rhizosphaerae]|uniref:Recombinase family protein n=1 Tax=Nocardia rhizosphaerae TaxID=1691571 RepID=A0ABV8LAJ4_9NOCA